MDESEIDERMKSDDSGMILVVAIDRVQLILNCIRISEWLSMNCGSSIDSCWQF